MHTVSSTQGNVMQHKKYNTDEVLLVKIEKRTEFAVFIQESFIRDRNIQVQLVDNNSKIWIRESQII